MSRVFVKVCGITTPEDGVHAAEAGADAVGFVFYSASPRFVERERAAAISRVLPPMVLRVGLFVDATRDEMARTADAVGLDLLQLHGHEPPEAFEGLPRRALKALRVGSEFAPEDALRYEAACGILVDTRLADETAPLGGTGTMGALLGVSSNNTVMTVKKVAVVIEWGFIIFSLFIWIFGQCPA